MSRMEMDYNLKSRFDQFFQVASYVASYNDRSKLYFFNVFLFDLNHYSNMECRILRYTLVRGPKGRFTRYDFCLRLSHAIFVARGARVMKKSYTISTISNLPVATIVVGF